MSKLKEAMGRLGTLQGVGLMCFCNPDGSFSVVNSMAEVIAVVGKDECGPPDKQKVLRAQWMMRAKAMLGELSVSKTKTADGWPRKCETWVTCLRSREFDKWRKRKTQNGRFFNEAKRPNWESAVVRMMYQFENKGLRKMRFAERPWLQWAETCSKNHNRKERCRVGKKQGTDGAGRRSELQMCFKWRSSVAGNV